MSLKGSSCQIVERITSTWPLLAPRTKDPSDPIPCVLCAKDSYFQDLWYHDIIKKAQKCYSLAAPQVPSRNPPRFGCKFLRAPRISYYVEVLRRLAWKRSRPRHSCVEGNKHKRGRTVWRWHSKRGCFRYRTHMAPFALRMLRIRHQCAWLHLLQEIQLFLLLWRFIFCVMSWASRP